MIQYIVALTCGTGSGKSAVVNTFSSFDVPLADADVIAREMIQSKSLTLRAIVKCFGQ
ncbi:dephospho-CoA kinase [Candidatus Doolittlea endobia]|uniref:dephospho-CoA kinase n=1 Tax=Candidatus Doolittlea endobia TaxID=1778262 RepID=UPI001E44227B|nr:dephospho-CoA kinase [Candidatus Doolittlea endobia]